MNCERAVDREPFEGCYVTGNYRVVHLCMGDRAWQNCVDRWLEAAGVVVSRFDDAYSLCAHLRQDSRPAPDAVAVGVDWLNRCELQVVKYVRQSWPGAVIIVYGTPQAPLDCATWDRLVVCSSRVQLDALLKRQMCDVLAGFQPRASRAVADAAHVCIVRPDDRSGVLEGGRRRRGVPDASVADDEVAEQEATAGQPLDAPVADAFENGPIGVIGDRAILTRDELAALLDESGE